MANNNTSVICKLSDSYNVLAYSLSITAYVGMTAPYFVICFISRTICVIAFYKQFKNEKAYGYQIFDSSIKLVEVTLVTLSHLGHNNLSGYRLPGAAWYQKNYFLMWYAAHLALPLKHGLIMTSLFMSVSMAADRAFALAKPFTYKNINHKRRQVMATIICFAIGLSTSIFDVFRYHVVEKSNVYTIDTDAAYIDTNAAFVLAILRNVVRIFGNVALILCNIVMIICYHSSIKKIADIGNDKLAAKRKSAQKSLILLTVCQSIFTTVDITMYNIYYTMVYSDANFTTCFGKVMSPVNDLTLQIAGVAEFAVLAAISKPFRDATISCLRCKNENSTVAIAIGQTAS